MGQSATVHQAKAKVLEMDDRDESLFDLEFDDVVSTEGRGGGGAHVRAHACTLDGWSADAA